MTGDKYKIVISISHQCISYEYWLRDDGKNKLVPMPNGKWPAPLAFYCSGTGIMVGEDAARAAHAGMANAFDDYFERSVEEGFYTIGGQSRPIRNLLLDASESMFRDFFQLELFGRYGSLSENRASMPLVIVCESDIKANERALLHDLFKDSGYSRVRVVEYDQYLNRYISKSISKEYGCDKVVVAWSEGNDLTFTMLDINNVQGPVVKNFECLGIDPRINFVKDLIWDNIIGQNRFLQRQDEEDAISKAAADFLGSSQPLVNGTIILSDGWEYHYSLNRCMVDCIQPSEGLSVKEALEQFLKENGITGRERVLLLLRGIVANNSYFEQNLRPGFYTTIKANRGLRDKVLDIIISEITPMLGGPIDVKKEEEKELQKNWESIKAEANGKRRVGQFQYAVQILEAFLTKCQAVPGADDVIAEIKAEIHGVESEMTEAKKVDPDLLKSLERQWREVKAKAGGMARSGKTSEARSCVVKFRDKVQEVNGTDKLITSIDKELSSISRGETLHAKPKTKAMDASAPSKSPVKKPQYEEHAAGQELKKQGKLKEARDWYRNHGDSNMAETLTKIIRAQKGIEVRKSSIDDCRRTKDKGQISRIIKEIQEFVELCEKAGINTVEYKKLLAEYRKIKV